MRKFAPLHVYDRVSWIWCKFKSSLRSLVHKLPFPSQVIPKQSSRFIHNANMFCTHIPPYSGCLRLPHKHFTLHFQCIILRRRYIPNLFKTMNIHDYRFKSCLKVVVDVQIWWTSIICLHSFNIFGLLESHLTPHNHQNYPHLHPLHRTILHSNPN